MCETGAGAQADLIEKRILDEGELRDYFNRDNMTRYRFGREPDGPPLNSGTGTTCCDVTAVCVENTHGAAHDARIERGFLQCSRRRCSALFGLRFSIWIFIIRR